MYVLPSGSEIKLYIHTDSSSKKVLRIEIGTGDYQVSLLQNSGSYKLLTTFWKIRSYYPKYITDKQLSSCFFPECISDIFIGICNMSTDRTTLPNTQACAAGTRIHFRKAGHKLTISTVVKSFAFTNTQMSDKQC